MSSFGFGEFAMPIWGGYGFGGLAGNVALISDDHPAPKPTDKVKPIDPVERPYGTMPVGGMGTLPGFDAAPPGSFAIYWQMRRFSTIVLAHTVVTAPILAGKQTIEVINDKGKPATADRIKVAAEEDLLPTVMDWLPGMLEALHFGHFLMEVEWDRVGSRTVPIGYHSVLPGEGILYRDTFRRFVGFQVAGNWRDARYALLATNQPHIDPIFGFSRNENVREEWWRIRQSEANADKTERKASGIQMAVGIPMGASFQDANGNAMFPKDIAQTLINAAVRGDTFTYPLTPFTKRDIIENPALADIPAIKVQAFDWGNIGPALEAHLSRRRELLTSIMRGWHRPEREAMEGSHGTLAESATQGEIGTTDTELVAAQAMRQFSRQVINRWAVTNFGPDAADMVAMKQAPLSDPQQEFLQKVTLALTSDKTTGPDFQLNFDQRQLADRVEIPLRPQEDVDADKAQEKADQAKQQKQQQQQQQPVGFNGGANGNGNGNGNGAATARPIAKRLLSRMLGEDDDSEGSPGSKSLALAVDEGNWVTIDGVHVLIKDGVITKGPAHLVGKRPGAATKEQAPNDKAARAKATHKPSSKEKQDWAEKNEHEAARKLNMSKSDDNRPMDMTVDDAKGNPGHGVELKSMLDNANSKITVHPESQARKLAWSKANKAPISTVVLDDRDKFGGGVNAAQYSGNRIYYKRGTGAYRLSSMHPAKSFGEVKKLMGMKENELPLKARG